MVAAGAALAWAAPASAELGPSFGAASLECDLADGYEVPEGRGATAPVSRTYDMPMAEIVGTSPIGTYGSVNLHGGRSVVYQDDTWFPRTPVRYWAQTGTLLPGESAHIEADCAEQGFEGGGKFRADVRYFARPTAPVTYTGSSNHGRSVLGFIAPTAGRYIVEVRPSPGEPREVYFGDFGTEDGGWDEPGVDGSQSKGASFSSAGVLELGALEAGSHALLLAGTWSDDSAALETWSATIREVTPEQRKPPLPEPPVQNPPPPPPDDPEPGPPGPPDPQGSVGLPPSSSTPPPAVLTTPNAGAPAVSVLGSALKDRAKPRLRVNVVSRGRRRAVIRVWAVSERTAVRLTVRRGDTVRRISRSLRKGQSVSLRTRLRPARVTVTGRDGAGNVATMRRALR